MNYQDKTIKCFDCGNTFTFTTNEQVLYNSIGHTHPPKRCPSCRQARKARQPVNSGSNYNRNNSDFSSANRSYSQPRQTFHIVCAECSKETEVPFQPRPGKPVYCSACYNKVRVSK
ncbi:MAG: zinc-ribbon domain containing protein [Dehalococcoidia bacterium]|nr:zinc-ribbon domain containing protein [Dehalococcoidia bacterium]